MAIRNADGAAQSVRAIGRRSGATPALEIIPSHATANAGGVAWSDRVMPRDHLRAELPPLLFLDLHLITDQAVRHVGKGIVPVHFSLPDPHIDGGGVLESVGPHYKRLRLISRVDMTAVFHGAGT